jgi:hypothetical protein
MIEVALGALWIFLVFYSPTAVIIGIPLISTSYYEIAHADPKVKPDMIATLLHDIDYYFHTNFHKNKDYRNSFILGVFFLITGALGFYILYKSYPYLPWIES